MYLFSDIIKHVASISYDHCEAIKLSNSIGERASNRLIQSHMTEYQQYYNEECNKVSHLYETVGMERMLEEYGI